MMVLVCVVIIFSKGLRLIFVFFCKGKVNMDYLEKDLAELQNHIRCKVDGNGSQVRLDLQLSNANLTDLLGTLASNESKNLE